MRIISKQELNDILDKHGRWLRNEDGGERANLLSADLRYVDLRYANLSYANLSSADLLSADLRYVDLRYANLSYTNLSSVDLRSADLRSANLSSAELRSADLRYADLRSANLSSVDLSYAGLITFQYQKDIAYYTFDGALRIGCILMPITEWVLGFKEIGKNNGYSNEQIDAYGNFIQFCFNKFKKDTK